MKQQPSAPICNCCGLSIRPGLGEDCPRCHYPLNPSKEERFLRASLQDLQRVAAYGGANITVSNLISRYHARLAFLQSYQAGVLPQSRPATPQVSADAANVPVVPQEAKPEGKTFVLPVIPPEIKPSPAPFVRPEEVPQNIPPVARAVVQTREPRRTVWQSFRQAWRSFVVDQAITLIGLLGAFLILMGALSSVVTTGNNPLLSFLVVFGVHAFFGIAGIVAFRFANFKLIARIYSGIYVLLIPLVGFTGYNLILNLTGYVPSGSHPALSASTLIIIASLYAAVAYFSLAVYQKFAIYSYLGAIALVVADLALAVELHLNYCWWPSMLMLLAIPALVSLVRSPETGRERYFTGSLRIMRQPLRIVMYSIVGFGVLGALSIGLASFFSIEGTIFYPVGSQEIRFSLLSIVVFLSIWCTAWLWLVKQTREMFWVAFLFLACVLAFCHAFAFSGSSYALTLACVALLYHGLNRFLPNLLQPLPWLSVCLEGTALLLVCLLPFIASPLLPQQLYDAAYQIPLTDNAAFFVHANWAAIEEMIALGLGCVITVSMVLLTANERNHRSWLFLISGFLLAWNLGVVVLALKLTPAWWFFGLALAFAAVALVVRERFGTYLANPLDVLALSAITLTFSLSRNENRDYQAALLLVSAVLSYLIVLYQRRQHWLFLSFVFAFLALPLLLDTRLYLVLLISALLPFVAVLSRLVMARRSMILPAATSMSQAGRYIAASWEWPVVIVALLYGAIGGLGEIVSILLRGGLAQSSMSGWLGIPFPIFLELALLGLAWYVAAALARVKGWLIPAIVFAASAVLLPDQSFWGLAAVSLAATLLGLAVSYRFGRIWASPLYCAGVLSALMTGIVGYQSQSQLLVASWLLLGFGLFFYSVSLLEDNDVGMWLLPGFTLWALLDALQLGDLYRSPIVVLVYAGLGAAISLLHIATPSLAQGFVQGKSRRDALPFYSSAFVVAVLSGLYGTLLGAHPLFYGFLTDTLLMYALVAFGIVLLEQRSRWLWLVVGFATWSILMATQQSIEYVCGTGLGLAVLGLCMSRVIKQRAFRHAFAGSSHLTIRLSWGWPWYLTALVAALVVGSWPFYNVGQLNFAVYALLAFAVLAYAVGVSEDFIPLLWIAPLLAALSLSYSAFVTDTTHLLVIALLCAALGVAVSCLKYTRWFIADRQRLFNYALPIYVIALAAAFLTGLDGTLYGGSPIFYFVVLMSYALLAYAIALVERRAVWLGIMVGFGVWSILWTLQISIYYAATMAIVAGIVGMVSGRLHRRFLRGAVDLTAPLQSRWKIQFKWSWSWYMMALAAAGLTGLWPYLPVSAQPGQGFIENALLLFAVLFYVTALVEASAEMLWIGSAFSIWSLVSSTGINDFPRLFVMTFVYALLGAWIGRLKLFPTASGTNQGAQRWRYMLPFYVTAFSFAIAGGRTITLSTLHNFLGGTIPDALPLLIYAALAFGILIWERQSRWLSLVVGFGIWGIVLAPRDSIGWLIGIAIATALIGLLVGRILGQGRVVSDGSNRRSLLSNFEWSWSWYLISFVAMLWMVGWQQTSGAGLQSALVAYSLLIFAGLVLAIMLIERVPEILPFSVFFAALAILFWSPPLDSAVEMLAFTALCVLVFGLQVVWRVITPVTRSISTLLLHTIIGMGGQLLVIMVIIGKGGFFNSSGWLAFVGAGSLLALGLMVYFYGRIQQDAVVRRICDYLAGLLGALMLSWLLSAFGQTNLDLLTLVPATYLIIITPLLLRDESLPGHRVLGEMGAVLGAILLLLPTLWLSFNGSESNLWYTLILLGEALVLLLVGIAVGVRIFVLTGAGLIVVAALHALFLPSLGIPTPVALTLLGCTLLGVATGLSIVRRRLRSAWSQWE